MLCLAQLRPLLAAIPTLVLPAKTGNPETPVLPYRTVVFSRREGVTTSLQTTPHPSLRLRLGLDLSISIKFSNSAKTCHNSKRVCERLADFLSPLLRIAKHESPQEYSTLQPNLCGRQFTGVKFVPVTMMNADRRTDPDTPT